MRWLWIDRLGLLRVGPGQLGQHDVRCDLQAEAHPGYAVSEQTATATSGSFTKASTVGLRRAVGDLVAADR